MRSFNITVTLQWKNCHEITRNHLVDSKGYLSLDNRHQNKIYTFEVYTKYILEVI